MKKNRTGKQLVCVSLSWSLLSAFLPFGLRRVARGSAWLVEKRKEQGRTRARFLFFFFHFWDFVSAREKISLFVFFPLRAHSSLNSFSLSEYDDALRVVLLQ